MLVKAVTENRPDIVGFLLENGAEIAPDAHLLHLAVARNNPDLVRLLLPRCPVDDRDDGGRTPLHLAASAEMAALLLENGASPDIRDAQGHFPYELAADPEARRLLKQRYDELHPVLPVRRTDGLDAVADGDWERRFTVERMTMHDLIPAGDGDPQSAEIVFDDRRFRLSRRFYTSFARRMKFSTSVFLYFSPQEFLSRVAERNPDASFQVTFDNFSGELLGVTDPDRKLLPAHIACKVIADDPRTRKIVYRDGVWEAEIMLDKKFHVPRAGDYYRKIQLNYPVDGMGMPSIYLATERVVCSNGAVAAVAAFRTDIEVNDESGVHLGKLLRSFNNDYGFSALNDRLSVAQDTLASVNELLRIDAMIAQNVGDRNAYRKIHDRLNELAGDPCYRYGVTSLQSIPHKKQTLMPVACSVNDLLNVCSELTTHYGSLLHRPLAFDEKAGEMLSQEFDLEGMYRADGGRERDFFLSDLKLDGFRTEESVERENDLVYANE